jgi:hypothetical protein
MENNGKTIIYIVLALILGLGGGYYYGSKVFYEKGHSVGYEQARVEIKTQLENKRIVEPTPTEVRVISGTIQSIGNSQFVIESRLPFDPTLPEGQQSRTVTKTVTITPETEITVRVVEANKEPAKAGVPFRPFIVKNSKIDFSTLKVSDSVVVEASENIANKATFEAVSVFKNSQ